MRRPEIFFSLLGVFFHLAHGRFRQGVGLDLFVVFPPEPQGGPPPPLVLTRRSVFSNLSQHGQPSPPRNQKPSFPLVLVRFAPAPSLPISRVFFYPPFFVIQVKALAPSYFLSPGASGVSARPRLWRFFWIRIPLPIGTSDRRRLKSMSQNGFGQRVKFDPFDGRSQLLPRDVGLTAVLPSLPPPP